VSAGAGALFRRRTALLVAALILPLVLVEALARLLAPEQAPIRLGQLGDVLKDDPREQFLDLVRPDPELFWSLAPSVRLAEDRRPFYGLIANAQGLREEREIPRTKARGERRLLFIGDSCTFGYLLRPDESYVEQVERRLAARFSDRRIECINAGVPGYTLFQGCRFLETRGAEFAPDLVVLNFGWNENVVWDGQSDEESHRRLRLRQPPSWLAGSALARRLWSLRGRETAAGTADSAAATAGGAKRPRVTPDEFTALLERCRSAANGLDAELLVLVGGARFNLRAEGGKRVINEYQSRQYRFGETLRLEPGGHPAVVDGVAVAMRLSATLPVDALFLDQTHPSARLNEAVAEALVGRIAPWLEARGTE
jgi:lysophospholipase L1-like esterase